MDQIISKGDSFLSSNWWVLSFRMISIFDGNWWEKPENFTQERFCEIYEDSLYILCFWVSYRTGDGLYSKYMWNIVAIIKVVWLVNLPTEICMPAEWSSSTCSWFVFPRLVETTISWAVAIARYQVQSNI